MCGCMCVCGCMCGCVWARSLSCSFECSLKTFDLCFAGPLRCCSFCSFSQLCPAGYACPSVYGDTRVACQVRRGADRCTEQHLFVCICVLVCVCLPGPSLCADKDERFHSLAVVQPLSPVCVLHLDHSASGTNRAGGLLVKPQHRAQHVLLDLSAQMLMAPLLRAILATTPSAVLTSARCVRVRACACLHRCVRVRACACLHRCVRVCVCVRVHAPTHPPRTRLHSDLLCTAVHFLIHAGSLPVHLLVCLPVSLQLQECPAGSYCASATSAPLVCPLGSYSAARAQACTTCRAGYFCTTTAETLCNTGYWSPENSTSCQQCDAGFLCLAADRPHSSPNAYPCNAGGYCDGAVRTECPDGTYGDQAEKGTLAEACIACPAGWCCWHERGR